MPDALERINGTEVARDEQDTSAYLLYHAASHVTGNRLGDYLGIPHGRELHDARDYVIRWGSRTSCRPARENVYNSRESLNENTNKYQTLVRLHNAGIPVPDYTRSRDAIRETFGYPALGRQDNHTRGEDINLILQWRDAYLTSGNDYFVEYIPTDFEYRMHVIDGEVVKVHEKRLRSEADNHPFIRNGETGWVFLEPREDPPDDHLAIDAVGALGLDFGAVDIVRGEDGQDYVLEVNSAPSLDEANLERYGDRFAELIGLEDYPGLEAVDWDDEEEEAPEAEEGDGGGDDFRDLFE